MTKEVKKCFTLDKDLLEEFKTLSKENAKFYKTSMEEAIKLWIKEYEDKGVKK